MKSFITVLTVLACGLFTFSAFADQRDSDQQSLSGELSLEKDVSKDDETKAFEHYLDGAKKGRWFSKLTLRALYYFTSNETEISPWLQKAADQGESGAQLLLGKCYLNGTGIKQDYGEAVKWFHKSAEGGNPDAQTLLGKCYFDGTVIKQDYSEAVKWFREAAHREYPEAEKMLGVCYFNGTGVEQDFDEAINWFCKSTWHDDMGARRILRYCYHEKIGENQNCSEWPLFRCSYDMDDVEADYAEAAYWCRNAANGGFPVAQWTPRPVVRPMRTSTASWQHSAATSVR